MYSDICKVKVAGHVVLYHQGVGQVYVNYVLTIRRKEHNTTLNLMPI